MRAPCPCPRGLHGIWAYIRRGLAILYGSDPKGVCLFYNALTSWMLGYPDQARQRCHEALDEAQLTSHTHSLAAAQNWAAILHHIRGERGIVQDTAQAAISLSEEQGFPHWLTMGMMLQGWASAMQQTAGDGLEQLTTGLAAWRAGGSELLRPYFLSLLAEVQLDRGQTQEGLQTLDEALQAVEEQSERFYEAELYRLKGESLLAQKVQGSKFKVQRRKRLRTEDSELRTDFSEAEDCFQRAISIARAQAAKSWELRATLSLARLWEGRGKATDARQMLSEVYNWFTEGFETVDLRKARAMLDQLA